MLRSSFMHCCTIVNASWSLGYHICLYSEAVEVPACLSLASIDRFFVVCLCREIKGNSCFKLLWISYVNRLKWRRHRNFCRGTVWKVVSHICSYMAQLCLISWIADSTSNSWSLMLNWLSAADFFVKSIIYYAVPTRDGPKFGRRRSSAECSARFGSATCDYSAELRLIFGVICSFAFAAFCARRWR